MKRIKRLFCMVFVVTMFLCSCVNVSAAGDKSVSTDKKTGWITKGKNTYYRTSKGKLVKNQTKTIGKNTYLFDKKGRVVKGVKKNGVYYDYYSKADGRYLYSYIDLKIKTMEDASVIGKKGSGEYRVFDNVRFLNRKGKSISFHKLRKGQKIRVYFQGNEGILETFPAQFAKVIKVKAF